MKLLDARTLASNLHHAITNSTPECPLSPGIMIVIPPADVEKIVKGYQEGDLKEDAPCFLVAHSYQCKEVATYQEVGGTPSPKKMIFLTAVLAIDTGT